MLVPEIEHLFHTGIDNVQILHDCIPRLMKTFLPRLRNHEQPDMKFI